YADRSLVDQGIGIDEDQQVAARRPGASVACCRDLAVHDRDHPCAELLGNRGGPVRGRIVCDYDLKGLIQRLSSLVDRVQGAAKQQLLVVGWDDEGNHGPVSMAAAMTEVLVTLLPHRFQRFSRNFRNAIDIRVAVSQGKVDLATDGGVDTATDELVAELCRLLLVGPEEVAMVPQGLAVREKYLQHRTFAQHL